MLTVQIAIRFYMQAGEADGLKAITRKTYQSLLRDFERKYGAYLLPEVIPETMRQYVINIRRCAKSEITAIDKIVALHTFWHWASDEYQVANPMARIKHPVRPRPAPKAPSIAHVKALIKAIPAHGLGLRDLALLMLVVDAGLRISEALNLKITDVNFYRRQIVIRRGKGDRTRIVPFTNDVEKILSTWLKRRMKNSEFVFSSVHGKQMNYQGARQALRRMHKNAGLAKFYSWHTYRHFSAQQYRLNGGDVFDLQKILGHEEITTTVNHYGNFIPDELINKHEYLSAVNVLREEKGI